MTLMAGGKSTWRVVTGLLLFWLAVLLYMSSTLYSSSTDSSERTERQLAKALQELDALKLQNAQLRTLADQLKDIRLMAGRGQDDPQAAQRAADVERRLEEANRKLAALQQLQQQQDQPGGGGGPAQSALSSDSSPSAVSGPSGETEAVRRKVESGVLEMWYHVSNQLGQIKNSNEGNTRLVAHINQLLIDGHDHEMTVMTDLFNLSRAAGRGEWRQQEARDLSSLVQNRLAQLQNPSDCAAAKKVVCNLNKGCGYGCQLHHVVYCMIIAYGTRRTLVLESKGWRYAPGGWETFFQPLSLTCNDRAGPSKGWGPPASIANVQVVDLPIVDSLHPRPPFMPLAIPADLAPRLTRLHGHPAVWWIGQVLKYILRPNPTLEKDMAESAERLAFKRPIVGVHVRRTDKVGTEAAFHSIDEYMVHVDDYYDLLEKRQPVDKRRIYLATDDPNLLQESRAKFPNYEIISDNEISKTAGLGSRYSESSLRGIIMDIHFLSRTDFLVCTFSSQVCRVAYEIMQDLHGDASAYFYSLDDIYYFGGQNAHNQEVLHEHHAEQPGEIDLQPGDLIGVAGNHWNGYSKGVNRRTGKTGLYPSYKVKDHVDIVEFPDYSDMDKKKPGES